jgi:uncharacterized protein related to proFAR isomerase
LKREEKNIFAGLTFACGRLQPKHDKLHSFFEAVRSLSVCNLKYHYSIPIVYVIRLNIATFGLDGKAVGVDAVFVDKGIHDGLSAAL